MALITDASGTVGAVTIGVETNLESAVAPGTAQAIVYALDFGALVTGEVAFWRVYTVVLASGTERLLWCRSFIGGMDVDYIRQSEPVPVDNGSGITIRSTVTQKNGTGRSYPWKRYHPA